MDVWRITVAALRRWYVLLPLLGLTVLLVLGVGRGVKEEFDVTGATMIVPGQTLAEVPNPYGGPADANVAVGIVVNSPEARRQISEQGLIPGYEVSPQSRSNIMNFQVRGDTPQKAVETGIAVFRMAAVELRDRQTAAGIPLGAQYSIDVLQAPSVSAAVTDGKVRNMAVVGVLGAALSLLVAVLFDDIVGLVRRYRRRRQMGTDEPETGTDGPVEGSRGAEVEVPAPDTAPHAHKGLSKPRDPDAGVEQRGTAVSDAR